jgi:hypothetical protein
MLFTLHDRILCVHSLHLVPQILHGLQNAVLTAAFTEQSPAPVVVERYHAIVRLEVHDAARNVDGFELLDDDIKLGVGVECSLVRVDGSESSL